VKLLLDTHVVLWWRLNSPRLRSEIRKAVGEAEVAFVSAASAWEAAVKAGLGKLDIPEPFDEAVQAGGFSKLVVEFSHAAAVADLPLHHRDPFDRMLVAQATVEGLTLVTHDPRFRPYRVPVLWA
jgi:PIN domain nuclease of toxin-antitoxin system